jgi:hypothetical protein
MKRWAVIAALCLLCGSAKADLTGPLVSGFGAGITGTVGGITSTPVVTNCNGVVDFSVGCALPMFRGIP